MNLFAGFGLLEAGSVSSKNEVNIMVKVIGTKNPSGACVEI